MCIATYGFMWRVAVLFCRLIDGNELAEKNWLPDFSGPGVFREMEIYCGH